MLASPASLWGALSGAQQSRQMSRCVVTFARCCSFLLFLFSAVFLALYSLTPMPKPSSASPLATASKKAGRPP